MTPVRTRALRVCLVFQDALRLDRSYQYPDAAATADAEFRAAIAEALEEAAADLERWAEEATTDGATNERDGFHVCGWDACCAEDGVLRAAARVRARKDGLT